MPVKDIKTTLKILNTTMNDIVTKVTIKTSEEKFEDIIGVIRIRKSKIP